MPNSEVVENRPEPQDGFDWAEYEQWLDAQEEREESAAALYGDCDAQDWAGL